LRRRKVTTAERLAEELEVSQRTIYRDIFDLMASGVPIYSEAGVGYMLRGYDLPPLMFTEGEIEALTLGGRIVKSWADKELADEAQKALDKIESALPDDKKELLRDTALFAPPDHARAEITIDLPTVRKAIRSQHKIRFAYKDAGDSSTSRTVRPFSLAFYGPVWILGAWCELRKDYRGFRPDRMEDLQLLDETFTPEPGINIYDYIERMMMS